MGNKQASHSAHAAYSAAAKFNPASTPGALIPSALGGTKLDKPSALCLFAFLNGHSYVTFGFKRLFFFFKYFVKFIPLSMTVFSLGVKELKQNLPSFSFL